MKNTSLVIGLLLMLSSCSTQTKSIPISITSQIQHDVQSIMQAKVSCQNGKPVATEVISFKLDNENIPVSTTDSIDNAVKKAGSAKEVMMRCSGG